MFTNIRWRMATAFMKRAHYQIGCGDFKSIQKGLKNVKRSIIIMPRDKAALAYLKMSLVTLISEQKAKEES